MQTNKTKQAMAIMRVSISDNMDNIGAGVAIYARRALASVAVITTCITMGVLTPQSASAMTNCSVSNDKISATPVTLAGKNKHKAVYVCQNSVTDRQLSKTFQATELVKGGSQAISMGSTSKSVDLSTTSLTLEGFNVPELDMNRINQSFPRNGQDGQQNLFTFYQFYHKNKRPTASQCSQRGNNLLKTLKAHPQIFVSTASGEQVGVAGGGSHIATIRDAILTSDSGQQTLRADIDIISTGYGKAVAGQPRLPNEHANWHAAKTGYFCTLGVQVKLNIDPNNDNLISASDYNAIITVR